MVFPTKVGRLADRSMWLGLGLFWLGTTVASTGCDRRADSAGQDPRANAGGLISAGDSHSHATTGPHQGTLIELGNETYHAELVHDDDTVTIYILDETATGSVAIASSEITINLLQGGQPKQYQLIANATETDPAGSSSRFSLANRDLIAAIERSDSEAKLSVKIDGKSYRGSIAHAHDHAHEH